MPASRTLRLAVVASLAVVGLAPATAVTASATESDASAPVQVLPLTTSGGDASDLAQEQTPSSDASLAPATTSQGGAVVPAAVAALEAGVSLDPEKDATLLTDPLEVSDFLVAGFTWSGQAQLPTGTQIYLRVRENDEWSDWFLNDFADAGPDDATTVSGTEEFVTGGADAIQAAVVTPDGQLPRNLSLSLIPGKPQGERVLDTDDVETTDADPTPVAVSGSSQSEVSTDSVDTTSAVPDDVTQDALPEVSEVPASTSTGQSVNPAAAGILAAATTANGLPVPVTTRSEWGAKSSYMSWDPEYVDASHVIVHHTAGTNDYTASQSASIVAGIYYYHAITLDWGDIGYNFLVDKYGQVFEGRYGTLLAAPGKMVVGGHALGANTGTMGISMMGNFVSQSPTDIQIDRVGKLAGWFLKRAGVASASESANFTIRTTAKFRAGQVVALPRIMGHRDVNYTECPGDAGYAKLATIRSIAQQVISGTTTPSQPSITAGWKYTSGAWYYYRADGSKATGWLKDGDYWYYLASDGAMQTGWQNIGGKRYLFNASGQMLTGWYSQSGHTYYFTDSGAMATGWALISGTWYYLSPSTGIMATGWLKLGASWYYLNTDGRMVTGWSTIGGQRYYFNASGVMLTGTATVDGVVYQFADSGALITGWQLSNGTWRYYSPSGAMAVGWQTIGSSRYYFASNGVMVTGWLQLSGTWYYLTSSGAAARGWMTINNVKYYFKDDNAMAVGWARSGSYWYYFMSSGAVAPAGWLLADGHWYYLDSTGAAVTGWKTLNGIRYYFNPSDRSMAVGWTKIGSDWYYMDASGRYRTGWLNLSGQWFYLQSNGVAAVGWYLDGSTWYYLKPDRVMATGWFTVGGARYYANSSGAMVMGWLAQGSSWYYLTSSGAAATGWAYIGNTWYYFDQNGLMRTGWYQVGNTWYYSSASGAMQTGWLNLGGTWYYLSSSGAMVTGVQLIDGRYSQFASSGAWLGYTSAPSAPQSQSLHPVMTAPTASRAVVVNKMVAAYKASGMTYPSAQLAKGGAGTIEVFAGLVYDEATAEGVSPELLFVQAMAETGWLQFGGDVKISQFNFGGLGATGNGVAGSSFASVQIGLRAQVQHLRAYADANASASTLSHEIVDPRFVYVRKGSAPYIEYLGIQENPNRTGWAGAKNYGYALVTLINRYFA